MPRPTTNKQLRMTRSHGSHTASSQTGRQGQERGAAASRGGRLPGHRLRTGSGNQPIPVTVEPKALSRILHCDSGANTLITLRVEGESDARVLVKEYQLDPITHDLLHADFYRVAMDQVIQVTVPITLKGEPRASSCRAASWTSCTRQIEVECLPGDIPEQIDVDVTELMMNDGVRVRDLATGGNGRRSPNPRR